MKSFTGIVLLLVFPFLAMCQDEAALAQYSKRVLDSLHLSLQSASNDSFKMDAFRELGFYYQQRKFDSSLYFHEQQLALARKLKLQLWEADALSQMGYVHSFLGNLPESFRFLLESQKITEDLESAKHNWNVSKFSGSDNADHARLSILAINYFHMGVLYSNGGDENIAFTNHLKALNIAEAIKNAKILCLTNMTMGLYHYDQPDSAIHFFKTALDWSKHGYEKYNSQILSFIGNIYTSQRKYELARPYYLQGIEEGIKQNNPGSLAESYYNYAGFFSDKGDMDSSLLYARKGYNISIISGIANPRVLNSVYSFLSYIYEKQHNIDSAFYYQKLAMQANDSLNNAEKIRQFQNVGFNEQLRLQELQKEKIQTQNKIRTYAMLTGLGVFLTIGLILYRNNQQKQKANKVLESTLTNLKSTQTQLIQSEKMASLGELTAGIAHEIQNPLNFINNFSEVSNELLDEMITELSNANKEDAIAIADDVKQNLEKILHHGKRADGIVKGMLQHSRSSSAVKEPTDINKLADEYLRLAYHGLRAKDESFNATLKTDYDESIGNINIIPQDIGRVILNLINNAFYAASLASKGGFPDFDDRHEPTVWVSTKKVVDKVLISVRDNGPGIPQKILDKIFQPFFTTKPTGQGTGLGLSLSYDIVKAHGGEISVDTKEGQYTEFIISIPKN